MYLGYDDQQARPVPYSPRTGRRKIQVVNLVLVVLVALAAATFTSIYLVQNSGDSDSAKVDETLRLRDRGVDTKKLTIGELFPEQSFVLDNRRYNVLTKESSERCDRTAIGPLVTTLEKYECSQVVRGTVRDEFNQFVATLGVVNLADAPSAAEVDSLLQNPSVNGAFTLLTTAAIEPDLTAQKKVIDRDHLGHYVLFVTVTKLRVTEFEPGDPALTRLLKACLAHLKAAVTKHGSGG